MPASQHKPSGFVAQGVAEDVAVGVIQLFSGLPRALRCYEDQAIRASGSVVLNLAEGSGRRGRDRKRFWQVAHASNREVQAAVRVVVAAGAVDRVKGVALLTQLDRLGGLTYGLWRGA